MADELEPIAPVPGEEWKPIARAAILCPTCHEILPVPLLGRIMDYPLEIGGIEKKFEITPEMDDVWAHWWGHDGTKEVPDGE